MALVRVVFATKDKASYLVGFLSAIIRRTGEAIILFHACFTRKFGTLCYP